MPAAAVPARDQASHWSRWGLLQLPGRWLIDTLRKNSGAAGDPVAGRPDQARRWRFWGGLALVVVLGGVVGGALVAVVTYPAP